MLSEYLSKRIMNNIVSKFGKVGIVDSGASAGVDGLYSAISVNGQHPGLITLSWGTSGYLGGITTNLTTNTVTSNPMTWTIPQSELLARMVMTLNVGGNDTVVANVPLPATIPTYPSGSGAYHIRGIQITMTEV